MSRKGEVTMNWFSDKNNLEHNKEYLLCLDVDNEIYSLQHYFKKEEGDIVFKQEGFYWFDSSEDVFKYSRIQPTFWVDIIKPIAL